MKRKFQPKTKELLLTNLRSVPPHRLEGLDEPLSRRQRRFRVGLGAFAVRSTSRAQAGGGEGPEEDPVTRLGFVAAVV